MEEEKISPGSMKKITEQTTKTQEPYDRTNTRDKGRIKDPQGHLSHKITKFVKPNPKLYTKPDIPLNCNDSLKDQESKHMMGIVSPRLDNEISIPNKDNSSKELSDGHIEPQLKVGTSTDIPDFSGKELSVFSEQYRYDAQLTNNKPIAVNNTVP